MSFQSVDPNIARYLQQSQQGIYRNHYTAVSSRTIRRAAERLRRRKAKKLTAQHQQD